MKRLILFAFFFILSIQTYKDRKNDKVFEWVNIKHKNTINAIHSMGGDGNCGFCCVRFGLYRDQSRWPEVKKKCWRFITNTNSLCKTHECMLALFSQSHLFILF